MTKVTKKKSVIAKTAERVKSDNERGARTNVIEELFFDFNRSRTQIYQTNFIRGIFFGMGSVIGGALIIAVAALVLGLFVDLPGGVGDFVQSVLDAMSAGR